LGGNEPDTVKHHACQSVLAVVARGNCDPPGLKTGLCVIRLMPNQTNFVHKKGAAALSAGGVTDRASVTAKRFGWKYVTILARDCTKMKSRPDLSAVVQA
jgi:hypothetical protein